MCRYGSVNVAMPVWLKSLLHNRIWGSRQASPRRKNSSFLLMLWIVFTLVGCSYVFGTVLPFYALPKMSDPSLLKHMSTGSHSSGCNHTLHLFSRLALITIFASLGAYTLGLLVLLRQPAVWQIVQPLPFMSLSAWFGGFFSSSHSTSSTDNQNPQPDRESDMSRRHVSLMLRHQPGFSITPNTIAL